MATVSQAIIKLMLMSIKSRILMVELSPDDVAKYVHYFIDLISLVIVST